MPDRPTPAQLRAPEAREAKRRFAGKTDATRTSGAWAAIPTSRPRASRSRCLLDPRLISFTPSAWAVFRCRRGPRCERRQIFIHDSTRGHTHFNGGSGAARSGLGSFLMNANPGRCSRTRFAMLYCLSGFQPCLVVKEEQRPWWQRSRLAVKFSRLRRAGGASFGHEIHRHRRCTPGVLLRAVLCRGAGGQEPEQTVERIAS